jgi:ABC-type phosphate transport system substrate-binding protein
MRNLVRRAAPVAVSVAALFAVAVPGTAIAKSKIKTDQLEKCAGSSIEGVGSTFQAPAEFLWTGVSFPSDGFNVSTSKLACSGTKKPTVIYSQTEANKGSGACLKDFGEGGATQKLTTYPYCATDEAPSTTTKEAMEKAAGLTPEKGEGIQTIPVLTGAESIIVHLPEGCKATSEPDLAKHVTKLGRLSFERSVIEGIYDGTITTWKAAIAANKSAADKLSCTEPKEEEDTITPVVRLDKSGTTHIFKAFLKQVNTAAFKMEEFFEINEHSAGHEHSEPCKADLPPESKTWAQVAEGCENQRWPEAAHVLRPEITGNPGVIKKVAETPSSIAYADMAAARENGSFTKKGEGGENTPGEQNTRFWVPVANSKTTTKKVEYAEPSTNGDVEALGNSNCSKTVFALKAGEKFPPASTRYDWSKVIGLVESKTYSICGLTYMLAARLYFPFLSAENPSITQEESQKVATTVSNYATWVLSEKDDGGGEEVKGHDYEPLPRKAQKVAEAGALEIGSKEA